MSCFCGLQLWFFSGLPEMRQFWSNPSSRCVYIHLTWICATLALVLGIVSTGYHSFMLSILMDMFLCSSLFQELIVIVPGRWPTACSGWQINGRELYSLSGCFPPCSMSPPLSLTPSFADRWHWEIRESDRVSSQTDPPGNIGESLDWQSFPVN